MQRLVPWGAPTFDPATEMMRKLEAAGRTVTGTALLDGVRVIDVSGEAAAYTGRMFVDLGADVVLRRATDGIGGAAKCRRSCACRPAKG